MTWQSSIAIISGPDDLGLFAWHWNFSHGGMAHRYKGYGTLDECRSQVGDAQSVWYREYGHGLAVNGCVDY